MDEEENWLHSEQIECPSCHQLLYKVDHSPFYDEHFFYCDRCPIHVEVSYYDPVYQQIQESIRQINTSLQRDDYTALMHALEERLQPCTCGGTFRHDTPRRCFICHTPVIIDTPLGIDLFRWHDAFLTDCIDIPDKVLEDEERWMSQFVRTENKWRQD
jgi:hypothetical protein